MFSAAKEPKERKRILVFLALLCGVCSGLGLRLARAISSIEAMYISNIIKSVFTVLLTISIIGTGCSRDDSEPGTIRDASIRDGEQAIAADDPGEIESVGYDGHEVQPSEKNVLGEKLTEEANVSEGELSFEDVEIRERLTRLIAEEAYERSGWDDVGVRFFREVDGELYAVVWPNPRRVSLHARVRITSEGEIIEYRRESR